MNRVLALSAVLLVRATCALAEDVAPAPAGDLAGLVVRIERSFNEKDAVALQSCFHADAVYINPPSRNHGVTHEVISGRALRDLLTMSTQHPVTAGGEMLVIDGTGAFTRLEHGDTADMLLTSAVRAGRMAHVRPDAGQGPHRPARRRCACPHHGWVENRGNTLAGRPHSAASVGFDF
jgi:hypothetical protein